MTPSSLIRYIVWYATQRHIDLTTVRLVKFVYLADVFHARSHSGATLTGFPWAFVYFGPYCSEVMKEIDRLSLAHSLDRKPMPSHHGEKDYFLFSCRSPEAEHDAEEIPSEVLFPLHQAIRSLGDDTAALLDYVYFETEPMEHVRKGDILDFSKARPVIHGPGIELNKLSRKSIQIGKEQIIKLARKAQRRKALRKSDDLATSPFLDDIYYSALEQMDSDDLGSGLTGTARIDLE